MNEIICKIKLWNSKYHNDFCISNFISFSLVSPILFGKTSTTDSKNAKYLCWELKFLFITRLPQEISISLIRERFLSLNGLQGQPFCGSFLRTDNISS